MEDYIIAPSEPEIIEVYLTPEKTPVAYERKIKELVESGAMANREEAEAWIKDAPFVLELIYDIDSGLFAVESEAIEANACSSPHSGVDVISEDDIE